MARKLTLADGQLAAAAATILAGSSLDGGEGGKVQVLAQNVGSSAETVVLTMQRAGGTARRVARAVLAANEQLLVTGLPMQPDDTLLGTTTNATSVDYLVTASDGPLTIRTLGAAGAEKSVRSEVSRTIQVGTRAKVGGTAGWTVGAANDLPYVGTVAASQTAATLVILIDGLAIGDTITGFKVVAQIESAGGAVTLDAILRATTNVAAEPTDAAIGTGITQISVTADTAATGTKTGLTEVVTSGKTYYLLLTATTAAATDIILQACEISFTTS